MINAVPGRAVTAAPKPPNWGGAQANFGPQVSLKLRSVTNNPLDRCFLTRPT